MAEISKNHNRLVIGVTGGIASGKSTVSETLESLNVQRINVDAMTHKVLQPDGRAYREVVENWPQFVDEEQNIVRKALRQHVFAKGREKERKLLEAITRPAIKTEIDLELANPYGYYTIYESALLFETGADEKVDSVLVVDAQEKDQIGRAILRDGPESRVEEIMDVQMSRQERVERGDHVLYNNGTLVDLRIGTLALHFGYFLPLALTKSAPKSA